MEPPIEYRQLNPKMDWPFFDSSFHSTPADTLAIYPLTKAAAENFWDEHISPVSGENHPMRLPVGHWLNPNMAGPNWDAEFWETREAESAETGEIAKFLQQGFGINEKDRVFFIAARARIYLVELSCFLRVWPCFLAANDEAAFLFHPPTGIFAVFGSQGAVSLGRKTQSA